MNSTTYVPRDLRAAGANLKFSLDADLSQLEPRDFTRVWSSIAYLYPGLHADDFGEAMDGWPNVLRPFAEEAWRRRDSGTLSEKDLYPVDAAWAGICDRKLEHTTAEKARRTGLLRFAST